MHSPRTGSLLIVSSPSGAGKSTLLGRLLAEDDALTFSVSHTTRAPRTGEIDGREYFFVDRGQFLDLIERGAFLEWADVHGAYYGTSGQWVEAQLAAGKDVVLDIDVAGGDQVVKKIPDAVRIFILPPNMGELQRRLNDRGQDDRETVDRRMRNALGEIERAHDYDYAVVNDDLETCLDQLRAILTAARNRASRNRAAIGKVVESFSHSG